MAAVRRGTCESPGRPFRYSNLGPPTDVMAITSLPRCPSQSSGSRFPFECRQLPRPIRRRANSGRGTIYRALLLRRARRSHAPTIGRPAAALPKQKRTARGAVPTSNYLLSSGPPVLESSMRQRCPFLRSGPRGFWARRSSYRRKSTWRLKRSTRSTVTVMTPPGMNFRPVRLPTSMLPRSFRR